MIEQISPLNFNAFAASRSFVSDVEKLLCIDQDCVRPALVYADTLFIEICPAPDADASFPYFSLVLGNWSAYQADLGPLEELLWWYYLTDRSEAEQGNIRLAQSGFTLGNTHDLDVFVRAECRFRNVECDGDELGILFSGGDVFTIGEVRGLMCQYVETLKQRRKDEAAAAAAEPKHDPASFKTRIRLAQQFGYEVQNQLSRNEWLKVQDEIRAKGPDYWIDNDVACPVADICDANMIMHAAWIEVIGNDGVDADDVIQTALWNDAWTLAQAYCFSEA